ncbi:thiamine-phosphate kinase [Halobacillus karajensis]
MSCIPVVLPEAAIRERDIHMDEFSFIRSIQPEYYQQSSLIKGIDDDAAVFRPTDRDIVTAVDTMVEGVHFSRETMEPAHIGYRVLAANLSDLAAMGSTPLFYMVSITIPPNWQQEELEVLYDGMNQLASRYKMDLIGGDTVSGRELSLTVTVIGSVPKEKARYRSVAKPGDILFVTGTLGDSRAGLEWLLNDGKGATEDITYLIERHREPTPRVEFAEQLEELERVALNDVSDGIANEANEIAEASDVDLHMDLESLPFSKQIRISYPDQYEEWGLSGGEDFELLGTVSEAEWISVKEAAERTGIPVTKIGQVNVKQGSSGVVKIYKKQQWEVLKPSGYTHLTGEGE